MEKNLENIIQSNQITVGHLKPTQHCKSTIFQFKKRLKFFKKM